MTIDREQQARAREVLDALPFERFPDRGVRWYSRKTVLDALQAFADEARLAERAATLRHLRWWDEQDGDAEPGWLGALIGQFENDEHLATAIRTPNEGEVS